MLRGEVNVVICLQRQPINLQIGMEYFGKSSPRYISSILFLGYGDQKTESGESREQSAGWGGAHQSSQPTIAVRVSNTTCGVGMAVWEWNLGR